MIRSSRFILRLKPLRADILQSIQRKSLLQNSCSASSLIFTKRYQSTASQKESSSKEDWRRSARKRANNIRDRASELRVEARGHYDDFREDPTEKTKESAKSLSTLFRLYGPVFVGTYGSLYLGTLGAIFLGVQTGALDPVSLFTYIGGSAAESKDTVELVVDFMREHTLSRPYADYIQNNPSYANLAVAWVATKFTEPLRLGVAASITPRVARQLGYVQKDAEPESKKKGNEGSS